MIERIICKALYLILSIALVTTTATITSREDDIMNNPANLTEAQMQELAMRIAALANIPTDAPAPGVRQYVGARYVPLFMDPIEWSNTREYEPLSIVTYQGNSYTSRQTVPTGIDIANENYWVNTGNFNAQINEFLKQLNTLKNEVNAVNDLVDANTDDIRKLQGKNLKNVVLIADSYGTTPTVEQGWTNVCKIAMERSGWQVWTSNNPGSNFTKPNDNFITQLQAVADSMTAEQRGNVGCVFVGGGTNDRNEQLSNILTGVGNFVNVAKTQFPNARIILATMMYAETVNGQNTTTAIIRGLYNNYQYCAQYYGIEFPIDSLMWMYYKSMTGQFIDDGFHPSAQGNKHLGDCVTQYILSGNIARTDAVVALPIEPINSSSEIIWSLKQNHYNTYNMSTFPYGEVVRTDELSVNTQFEFGRVKVCIPEFFQSGTGVVIDKHGKYSLANFQFHLNPTNEIIMGNYQAFNNVDSSHLNTVTTLMINI